MSDNELLLAISEMSDKKLEFNLKPVENRLRRIELQLQHDLISRIQNIEACYTDTYGRYQDYADKMQAAFDDIKLLKQVVSEHSEKLRKLA